VIIYLLISQMNKLYATLNQTAWTFVWIVASFVVYVFATPANFCV